MFWLIILIIAICVFAYFIVPRVVAVFGGSRTARIVVRHGQGDGVVVDAHVLSDILKSLGYTTEIVDYTEVLPRAALQFCIEHNYDLPAERNYVLINHEFFTDWDEAAVRSGRAIALCKTHAAVAMLQRRGLTGTYVGFTSPKIAAQSLDPKLYVHLAGQSGYKNTTAVIDGAILSGIFRNDRTLFVTARLPNVVLHPTVQATYQGMIVSQIPGHNIYICHERVPQDVFDRFVAQAGVHVAPSLIEGFGHIVNQGRAAGATVITTDAPPMNELVDAKSGILVPYRSTILMTKLIHRYHYPKNFDIVGYIVDPKDVAAALLKSISFIPTSFYQRDRDACYKNFKTLLVPLALH